MNFNMTIDPRVGQWLNVAAFFLSTLAMASWWQDFVSAKEAAAAVGVMNLLVSTLNFVLHGMPAPPSAPAVSSQPVAGKVAALLALGVGLAMFMSGQANAQDYTYPDIGMIFYVWIPVGLVAVIISTFILARIVARHISRPVIALSIAVGLAMLGINGAHAAKLTPAAVQQNPLALLQQFTVSDLQAADMDAKGQMPPDTIASTCYEALIPIVQNGAANPLPGGPGLFQAVQKIRDAKAFIANLQSPTGPLAGLNVACAPLVLDGINTLGALGINVGLVAATGGASSFLNFLPFKIGSVEHGTRFARLEQKRIASLPPREKFALAMATVLTYR